MSRDTRPGLEAGGWQHCTWATVLAAFVDGSFSSTGVSFVQLDRWYRYLRCQISGDTGRIGDTGATVAAQVVQVLLQVPHLADAALHGAGGGDAGVGALCLDAGRGEAAVRVPPARRPRPVAAGHRRHLRIVVDIYRCS